VLVLVLGFLVVSDAQAFNLRKMSLEERVSAASDVLIGTVDEVEPDRQNDRNAFVRVRVESVLKGDTRDSIRVMTCGNSPERCFRLGIGRRYIFFLAKPAVNPDEYYYSVNGRYGVTPADGEPPDLPPLPEEVANATVVLIGTVEAIHPRANAAQNEFAQIRVDETLEGNVPKTIRLLTKGHDPVRDVHCSVGRQYLFYLTVPADYYQSANGMYGVIAVDGKPSDASLPSK